MIDRETTIERLFLIEAIGFLTKKQRVETITKQFGKMGFLENRRFAKKARQKYEGIMIEKKLRLKTYIKENKLTSSQVSDNVKKVHNLKDWGFENDENDEKLR